VLHFDSWEFAVYSRLAVALDWRRALWASFRLPAFAGSSDRPSEPSGEHV